MACFYHHNQQAVALEHCHVSLNKASHIEHCSTVNRQNARLMHYCNMIKNVDFVHLTNCNQFAISDLTSVHFCLKTRVKAYQQMTNCYQAPVVATVNYHHCFNAINQANQSLYHCNQHLNSPTIGFKHCLMPFYKGQNLHKCNDSKTQKAVPVPCRYYPIKKNTDKKQQQRTCKIRPPSHQLPLPLTRNKTLRPSLSLPLPLQCWHDDEIIITPNLTSYLMHNTITATLGGIKIEPLSFSIKTDIDSYCWQGSIEISPDDYQKIKEKLNVERGNEPLINTTINNYQFSLLAEEQSRSRQFVNHSYSLSGRSLSARLGADYAPARGGMVTLDNYARQIVDEQLNETPITLDEFAIADWLIPAHSYSMANKSMIAVINEIAEASGGFVYSDPSQAKISLKKRYKQPAWELATSNADVVIPLDMIKQIDDSKRVEPRYNTVTLTSNSEGGIVYREEQGRDLTAPVANNNLFTDRDCIVDKGVQILSDSGTHIDYQLTLPFASKYQIELAKLGDIWQIDDSEGAWRGIVTSVAIDVKVSDGVPVVWQNVGIDRYCDV